MYVWLVQRGRSSDNIIFDTKEKAMHCARCIAHEILGGNDWTEQQDGENIVFVRGHSKLHVIKKEVK